MRACILTTFAIVICSLTGLFFAMGFLHDVPLLGVLFLVSIIPSFLIIFVAYRRKNAYDLSEVDEFFDTQKVPIEVLVIAFTMGIFSTIPVAFIGIGTNYFMARFASHWVESFWLLVLWLAIETFIFVACVEEGAKLWVASSSIDRDSLNPFIAHPYGVVLYAMSCALGFAGIENVMYVFQENPTDSAWYVAIARAFMSVPLHGTTGVMIGVGLARRRYLHDKSYSIFRILLVPVLVHGFYDFLFVLPFRDGPFQERGRGHSLQTEKNTVDIGELVGFFYIINIIVVFVFILYARSEVRRLEADYKFYRDQKRAQQQQQQQPQQRV
jgi:RsiW-degrading membrane proteinase PrsW (M82 family)